MPVKGKTFAMLRSISGDNINLPLQEKYKYEGRSSLHYLLEDYGDGVLN